MLVVDDNDDNREIYSTGLRHGGFEVSVACDGGEALEVARRCRPAIVIMDLAMPFMDGFEAIARLREMPETRNVYILVLSGFDDAESRKRAVEVGCDEYASKPFLPRALLERVVAIAAERERLAITTGVRRKQR